MNKLDMLADITIMRRMLSNLVMECGEHQKQHITDAIKGNSALDGNTAAIYAAASGMLIAVECTLQAAELALSTDPQAMTDAASPLRRR